MAPEYHVSRRRTLKIAGAAATTALIAGCSESDDDNGDGDANGAGEAVDIDPGTEIILEGQTSGWVGIEPPEIEGETNPTLGLQEGETYEVSWEQGDGSNHNTEIWDGDGNVVGGYATDLTNSPEDDDPLEFEVSDDMAIIRCEPHADMEAPIEVQ